MNCAKTAAITKNDLQITHANTPGNILMQTQWNQSGKTTCKIRPYLSNAVTLRQTTSSMYFMQFVLYHLSNKLATMGDQHWWVSTFLATAYITVLLYCSCVLLLWLNKLSCFLSLSLSLSLFLSWLLARRSYKSGFDDHNVLQQILRWRSPAMGTCSNHSTVHHKVTPQNTPLLEQKDFSKTGFHVSPAECSSKKTIA